ncbi:hypothetical protein GCM10009727_30460 [Actinomadura napierensis]|uniref:Uncharacterized protein n=1 Tax=Actinomadura napierensis TaxID=267854 RepID=A0ABN2Z2T0_9ACTN
MGTPLAAAAAATVNAWLQRSGASAPAVTLITRGLAIRRTLVRRARVASCGVSGMVNAGVLVLALALVVVAAVLLVVRLGRLR